MNFCVWSVARTPAQIQADIYSILSGSESNLVVYYKFDNTSGTVVINLPRLPATAYNGTVVNGSTWVSATIPGEVYVVTNIADSAWNPAPGLSRMRHPERLSLSRLRRWPGNDPADQRPDFLNNNITIDAGALPKALRSIRTMFGDFYHFQCDGCLKFLDPYQWKWQSYTRRRDPEQFRHRHPELLY